jgi:DNA-binding protein Alba
MVESNESNVSKPERKNDNIVYVGDKPFNSYVMACVTHLSRGAKEIHICARGKYTSRAIDIAEVTSKRFFVGKVTVGEIKIDSEGGLK